MLRSMLASKIHFLSTGGRWHSCICWLARNLAYLWNHAFKHYPLWHPTYRSHKYFQSMLLPGAFQHIPKYWQEGIKSCIKNTTANATEVGFTDVISPLEQINLCSALMAVWHPGRKHWQDIQLYSKKQEQVLASSLGLLNAPMSNPDPQDEMWASENMEEGTFLLTTPDGHSPCRLTAFSRG